MMAREWSQKVSQYPRAVVGKFFTAHTAGFEEVGINGGQDRGVFTEREALSGATNSERLVKMFQGGQIERETANGEREVLRVQERLINFLIVEKRTKLGETMIDRLAFIQFQNGMYTEAGHRGHTPLKTTFYLPPEDTLQFLDDIRKNPDLIADVFDSAVAPAIPEPVYRMPAHYVGIVSQEALETAETAGGWKKQQFDALANSTEWRHYARPHGGETPRG
jgi:hypothetical protein